MEKEYLNKSFYEERKKSLSSAEIIVPIVLKLLNSKSVVDIGCGTGEFLKVFKNNGINDILGIDGSWIKKERLKIPEDNFISKDLTKKVKINKKFDLAVTLEVGEHLPKDSVNNFIETLTNLSDVILFSSAIPLQGGDKHINEQWIDYWKPLFNNKGYVLIDCIRKRIWNNESVNAWYCQNTFIFAKENTIRNNIKLMKEFKETNQEMLSLVHPRVYLPKARIYEKLQQIIPKPIKRIITMIKPNI